MVLFLHRPIIPSNLRASLILGWTCQIQLNIVSTLTNIEWYPRIQFDDVRDTSDLRSRFCSGAATSQFFISTNLKRLIQQLHTSRGYMLAYLQNQIGGLACREYVHLERRSNQWSTKQQWVAFFQLTPSAGSKTSHCFTKSGSEEWRFLHCPPRPSGIFLRRNAGMHYPQTRPALNITLRENKYEEWTSS